MRNSDYLDPDAFSSPIATQPTFTVLLNLDSDEEIRLWMALHREAQRWELMATNKEARGDKYADKARERADIARSLLNKYRAQADMPSVTPADVLDW
jgi:hypothetical protein